MQRDRLTDSAFERRRLEVMKGWVVGSSRRTAILLKHAVKSEFALSRPVYQRREFAIRPTQIESLRPVVRRMYDETQAHLRLRRVESIRLYRGLKSGVVVGDVLESWSDDFEIALSFGTFDTLVETIPATRIFMYYGGPGWVTGPFGEQFEYLVLGEAPR